MTAKGNPAYAHGNGDGEGAGGSDGDGERVREGIRDGDGLACPLGGTGGTVAAPLVVAGVLAAAGGPPLVRAVRVVGAGCEPVNVIKVALIAAAAHTTTAAAAVTGPGLSRILPCPASLKSALGRF